MKKVSAYPMFLVYTGATALFFSMFSTVSSVYCIERVGLNAFQLLMVGFALEISCFVCQVPTGIIADMYSRKLAMVLGIALMGIGIALEGAVPNFAAVLIAQVLWGMGITCMSGADNAWIADELKADKLERVYMKAAQVNQMFTLVGIAFSAWMANIALNVPLLASGVLFMAFAAVVWWWMPETRFHKPAPHEVQGFHRAWQTFRRGMMAIRTSSVLILLMCIGLLGGLYSEGFDRLWTLHLLTRFTLPKLGHLHEVVWISAIQGVALILNIGVVEWLQRRFERNGRLEKAWVLLVVNALVSVSIAMFAVAGNFWLALASFWACRILRGINNPLYTALTNEYIQDSRVRATVLSTQGQFDALGEILGGPLVGAVVLKSSVALGLVTSSVILSPVALLYLLVLRQMRKRSHEAGTLSVAEGTEFS